MLKYKAEELVEGKLLEKLVSVAKHAEIGKGLDRASRDALDMLRVVSLRARSRSEEVH